MISKIFGFLAISLIISLFLVRTLKIFLDKFFPLKENYRGKELKVSGGGVIFIVWFFLVTLSFLVFYFAERYLPSYQILFAFLLTSSFIFGLLDDFSPDEEKGFRGHFKLLFQGEISGGILKLWGIGLASLVFYTFFATGALDWLAGALLISLSANFFNLLDLRPGRCIKYFLVFWTIFTATYFPFLRTVWWVLTVALVVPTVFILWYDLKEKVILGDSGSNMLGVWIGASIAVYSSLTVKLFLVVLLLGLHILAEFSSFTYWIEKIPPLRWFDNLGRAKED